MRTQYRIDDYQQSYFVIDSFDELLQQTAEADFAPIYGRLENLPDISPDAIVGQDQVIDRGLQTRDYRGAQS